MKKLLFLYNDLMLKDRQEFLSIPMSFISFGVVHAKLYWFTDTKKKQVFIIPPNGKSTRLTYGGIFLLNNYEEYEHKLHSYYFNLMPFTNKQMKEDLYSVCNIEVTPIRFNSIEELEKNIYKRGNRVTCMTFVGNIDNERIQHNMKRNKYYRTIKGNKEIFIEKYKEIENG